MRAMTPDSCVNSRRRSWICPLTLRFTLLNWCSMAHSAELYVPLSRPISRANRSRTRASGQSL
jgi:hypothetical protein